jgi:hypothetical protein
MGVSGLMQSPKRRFSPKTSCASSMSHGDTISIRGPRLQKLGRRPQVGFFGLGEAGAESYAELSSALDACQGDVVDRVCADVVGLGGQESSIKSVVAIVDMLWPELMEL